jgi:sarcosine oxidase
VTLVDQFEVGHPRGSSHGRSRIYRFSYPDKRYVGMMKDAIELWRALEAEAGTEILQRTGGLDMGKRLDAHRAALDSHSIPYEVLDTKEAHARWPTLTLPPGDVLYQADGGIVHADLAWRSLHDGALIAGATTERRRIDVLDPDGVPGFDRTVVTAGGWARALLRGAGIDLPVRPTRETVAYFRTADRPPTLVDWGEPSVYALIDPRYGLKAGEHIAGPETDPDADGAPNMSSTERLTDWVREHYRNVEPDPIAAETCIYTNTSDEHFILERHGSIVVGSACSGHGFKFAPLIGRNLAELATS